MEYLMDLLEFERKVKEFLTTHTIPPNKRTVEHLYHVEPKWFTIHIETAYRHKVLRFRTHDTESINFTVVTEDTEELFLRAYEVLQSYAKPLK